MTDADLLEHIAKLPHARGNFKQLVRQLGTKAEGRAALETALARLAARGDLIELRSGHFAVTARSREFATGRLNMHRDGYGFLISDRPMPGIAGDIFIPPESAKQAMHGDRVVVRIARVEADGRADGEIVKVLRRAHPTVVGEFRIGRHGQYVVPHEGRIQQWIEIPEGLEIPAAAPVVDRIGVAAPTVSSAADLNGMIVNVEVLEYPEKGENPVGRVIEILGHRRTRSSRPPRFPRYGRGDHRQRNRARFRRRRLGGAPRQRQLRSARAHRRRQPLRAARHAYRRGGPFARHERLLSRPRRAYVALRALHQHLLAPSA
jgi:ribonuclease R